MEKQFMPLQTYQDFYHMQACGQAFSKHYARIKTESFEPIAAFVISAIQMYGISCVRMTLAAMVNLTNWDSRYDADVSTWAKACGSFPLSHVIGENRRALFALNIKLQRDYIHNAARAFMEQECLYSEKYMEATQ